MANGTTIGCNQETKARLAAMKRDGETWDDTLNRLMDEAETMADVTDRLARLEESVETIPQRTADDLEQRFR